MHFMEGGAGFSNSSQHAVFVCMCQLVSTYLPHSTRICYTPLTALPATSECCCCPVLLSLYCQAIGGYPFPLCKKQTRRTRQGLHRLVKGKSHTCLD